VIDDDLLKILVCPEDRRPLHRADARLLEKLNRAIDARRVRRRNGQIVARPLDEGLVREDRSLLYPVIDGIPVLLADEAIPLERLV